MPTSTKLTKPTSRFGGLLRCDPLFYFSQIVKLASVDIAACFAMLILIALIGWWYSWYFYFIAILLALLLRVGEPSQISWQGPGVVEMYEPIETFLKLGHCKSGTNGDWDVWIRNRPGWKRWVPKMNVYLHTERDGITVRGPKELTSLLRMRFP